MVPEDPGEGGTGAQDPEQEGEEAVFEVVEPGGIDDEPGGDEDGGEHEEEGRGEHRPVRRRAGGMLRGLSFRVRHGGSSPAFWTPPPWGLAPAFWRCRFRSRTTRSRSRC